MLVSSQQWLIPLHCTPIHHITHILERMSACPNTAAAAALAETVPGRPGKAHPHGGGAAASVCQHCHHCHRGGGALHTRLVHLARPREASRNDGKAARTLEKLTLFRQFYVVVVVYIYFTRIVVYLLRTTTMQFEYSWVSDAADQLATLAFYVWTAFKFRPQSNNPYLKLEQSEIEL